MSGILATVVFRIIETNRNLSSDLKEPISKSSEVGRLLAPLSSRTFEELLNVE